MQFTLDGATIHLEPVEAFRREWGLGADFTMATFEPKNWSGLGSMEHAGPPLAALQERLLRAVPARLGVTELAACVDALTGLFRREFQVANEHIGLREPEIDFSAAGFQAILLAVTDQLVRLWYTHQDPVAGLDYAGVYQRWLDDSVRFSGTTHEYTAGPQPMRVQAIYYIYGRAGLRVEIGDQVRYVADPALSCPGANFMYGLGEAVAERLARALKG